MKRRNVTRGRRYGREGTNVGEGTTGRQHSKTAMTATAATGRHSATHIRLRKQAEKVEKTHCQTGMSRRQAQPPPRPPSR